MVLKISGIVDFVFVHLFHLIPHFRRQELPLSFEHFKY